MPMLQYLSENKPKITEEWEVWAIVVTFILGVVVLGIVIWKTRKW